ncbi:MAG TPA: tetratricopeptide repeat protein [Bacteroidia bacterium]|nr:tetratricopeptide repeat protein [Bacteroidia bacterium]
MRSRRNFLFFFFLLLCAGSYAQERDQLRAAVKQLAEETVDTTRVNLLNEIGWDTSYDNLSLGLKYCREALKLAEEIHYDKGQRVAYNYMGTIYQDMGELSNALDAHLKSLRIAEKNSNPGGMATSYMNLGLLYSSMHDPQQSLVNLKKAQQIFTEMKTDRGMAAASDNLGAIYIELDSFAAAEREFSSGYALAVKIGKPVMQAHCLEGLSKCFQQKGDTVAADAYMLRALHICDSLQDDYDLSQGMVSYADLLTERGRFDKAEIYLQKALAIDRRIGMTDEEADIMREFADLYEKWNKKDLAILYLKKYYSEKDSISGEKVQRHQKELEAVYENDKKVSEIAHLTKEKTMQTVLLGAMGVGVVLLLAFLVILFNRNNLRRRTNEQLTAQNTIIEQKNKDITDSIQYAQRIQSALLASGEMLRNNLGEHFVFYLPKDIVSGDFYWAAAGANAPSSFYLAVCDCTGHGVPGAFMSLLNISFLNEAVKQNRLSRPAEIFDHVRKRLIENISGNGDPSSGRQDGMDGILAHFENNILTYAAAHNAPVLVRKGSITELPADKMPVGNSPKNDVPFTSHEVKLEPGDVIYFFTDGFADQFGMSREAWALTAAPHLAGGKKFKHKNLRELLGKISHLKMEEQEKELLNAFSEWKGPLEQVDDILVIGIRV